MYFTKHKTFTTSCNNLFQIYLKAGGEGDLSDGKLCQSNNDPHLYTFDGKR